ncbi:MULTISPECIES: diaminobutyrate--2-oxoglutarate transaminase [Bacillus]|uniref:diaminobutyrate--2-oxoglutarate transaminase n=1 Tax=Bacillus TaxID=1386 RepID=UPI0005A31390|nr:MULTISPECIES: diaminobutyrate--2-oxoglutarate transaminase [Bacillus cereus group]AJG57679.1 2,4-diaminobutyrate 4-transaminase family protein [Bacillus cereus D17]MCU5054832.1 diaminobutyrate--2-oxoglutarate transaminase [Bacillus cereus]QKI15630.1 diaminobutyrate--2-oxoglutarate transaminase [Bacillus cereus]USL04273.1 diaminobutyrate--2-oxoglutarate transaminase [Bacillus anthracis]SEJ02526.1 diaminobutyrate aminotransferase apoenzyme [Bacillus thuringiensis]
MNTVVESVNSQILKQQEERESSAVSYPKRLPLVIQSAEGIYVYDMDGKRYIDFLSGAGTLALGHNHPCVTEAIQRMVSEKYPLHTLDITTPIKEKFIDEIFSLLPKEFSENAKIQFCGPTGGDAIEAAIKLVKTSTGKTNILSFQGGYHGATHGTMALSGNLGAKEKIQGLMPNVHFLPYPYEYRNPFGNATQKGHEISSRYIESLLDDPSSGINSPAAMILEVVQGEGGSIPAPIEWLKEMRRITKERGIPLIIDEVQTGLGRTGKIFAFEHADITPDVLVLSKAIGGSLPLSVMIYNKSLDAWSTGAHIGTFRGNQLAMATGIATIQFIKNNNIVKNVELLSEMLMTSLKELQQDIPYIGDVRGRGLMVGVEIVDITKQCAANGSYPYYPELARLIQKECFERGLILEVGGRKDCVLRFLPPLIITEEQLIEAIGIFEEAVKSAVQKLGEL